jgi:hypothetical protein
MNSERHEDIVIKTKFRLTKKKTERELSNGMSNWPSFENRQMVFEIHLVEISFQVISG